MSLHNGLSTSARVALTLSITLVAGVVILAGAAYAIVAERIAADTDRALLSETEAFSAALRKDVAPGSDLRGATRAYISARTGDYTAIRPILLVRFADGHVISNSDERLESAEANRAALDAERASRRFLDIELGDDSYRVATAPVHDPAGTVVAVFEAAMPLAPGRLFAVELLRTLALAGGAVAFLGIVLSFTVARAALRPLRHAAAAAGRVTTSSLDRRIPYGGPDDEVGRLVGSVNAMLDRLQAAFGEQRRFVADASHELRTPLAIISGHLEILADPELPGEDRADEIAIIADEAARMRRLVDDLLALARLESGTGRGFQPVELATLMEEVSAKARVLGERRIELEADDPVWVSGDPDGLLQALLNLLHNAFAHTTLGGLVRLSIRGEHDHAVLVVADDGTGIRGEDLPRLFDRFYRAHGPRARVGGGSGLGLAITKRLVELHGGRIEAANRHEGGAAFTINLPRISPP